MKVWEIIRIIEEEPVKAVGGDGIDIIFETPHGHRYEVFFDCGEPDYLHWFEPKGESQINFWPENAEGRVADALRYLAGNLLAFPHVSERLKIAALRAGIRL